MHDIMFTTPIILVDLSSALGLSHTHETHCVHRWNGERESSVAAASRVFMMRWVLVKRVQGPSGVGSCWVCMWRGCYVGFGARDGHGGQWVAVCRTVARVAGIEDNGSIEIGCKRVTRKALETRLWIHPGICGDGVQGG